MLLDSALLRRCSIACVIAAAAVGCSPDNVDDVQADPGMTRLAQSWRIDGSTDPSQCALYGASQIRVVLFDAVGSVYMTQFAPCDAFRTTQFVRVQPYTAIATFFDGAGQPVSRDVPLGEIRPEADATTSSVVDFKSSDLAPPPN